MIGIAIALLAAQQSADRTGTAAPPAPTPPSSQASAPAPARMPAQAQAQAQAASPDGMIVVHVAVDARSGPWLPAANPAMPFGSGDAAPPLRVSGFGADRDLKITIIPAGTTIADGQTAGSSGIPARVANDLRAGNVVYPSYYAPKLLYPIAPHALMAVFADAKGQLVGRPFPVGTGVRVPIPSGAAALQLGFNDTTSAGNQGQLRVTVRMPEP